MKQNIIAATVFLATLFFACDSGDKSSSEDPAGNIQISSTPVGAAIYLNNVNTSHVTPFTINDLDTGSYEIRVSKSGYFDDSIMVTVEAGVTATPFFTLVSLPILTGHIAVVSTPSGASIFLDAANTGKVTPDSLKGVSAGEHTVKLTLFGYTDTLTTVNVPGNHQTVNVAVTMSAVPFGNIFLSSTPPGAAIFLDGVNSSKITPDTLKNINPGDHTVKLTLNGYFDSTFTVTALNAKQTVNYATAMRLKKVPSVIQAIFDAHCIGCHSGTTPSQGQNLSESVAYLNIVNIASSQQPALKRIAPGDTTNSYLIRKVQGTPGITGLRMPRNGPPYLTTAQIDSICSWVINGALPR